MSSHSESKLWITSESLMPGFFNKYFPCALKTVSNTALLNRVLLYVSEMFFLATHTHLQALMPVLSWHYQVSTFSDLKMWLIFFPQKILEWFADGNIKGLGVPLCQREGRPSSCPHRQSQLLSGWQRLQGGCPLPNPCWLRDVNIWKRKMLFRVQEICFT